MTSAESILTPKNRKSILFSNLQAKESIIDQESIICNCNELILFKWIMTQDSQYLGIDPALSRTPQPPLAMGISEHSKEGKWSKEQFNFSLQFLDLIIDSLQTPAWESDAAGNWQKAFRLISDYLSIFDCSH